MSESLVIWIAKQENFRGDLGIKNHEGILKNMKSRIAFLEKPEHRTRFVFTPKHCSWLNPIENWFSKLQAHVIKKTCKNMDQARIWEKVKMMLGRIDGFWANRLHSKKRFQ